LGPYPPTGVDLVRATIEGLFPCRSPAEAAAIAKETEETDAARRAARGQP